MKACLESCPGTVWKGETDRGMDEWMFDLSCLSSPTPFVCIRLGDSVSPYPQGLKLNRSCLDFIIAPWQ